MFQNLIKFEHQIGDKVFHFICDPNSPIEHVKDALFQILKKVGAIEDSVIAQQAEKAAADQKEPVSEAKPALEPTPEVENGQTQQPSQPQT